MKSTALFAVLAIVSSGAAHAAEMTELPDVGGKPDWVIAIHGGAGSTTRDELSPELEMEIRADLKSALEAGAALLDKGAMDEPVRLVGVGVANLEHVGETQLALFGEPARAQRRDRLNEALDQIADRFGSSAVKRGGQGEAERAALSHQIKRGEAED